jgi:hypothetical protein
MIGTKKDAWTRKECKWQDPDLENTRIALSRERKESLLSAVQRSSEMLIFVIEIDRLAKQVSLEMSRV